MQNSFSSKNYKSNINLTSDNKRKNYKIAREYLPNLNYTNKNIANENIQREDSLQKEICVLEQIWNELEITYQYREAFSIYLKKMKDEYKNNIIFQEKNNLKKYKKALINLKKEISLREDNILLLKQYNNRLSTFNTNDQIKNIVDAVINLVKKLRINAINIVKEYSKIESISKNYSNLDKINKKIIKQDYSYDPNYIYKMQDDLLFLKESTLSKYFEMDNKFIDPFLTNFLSIATDSNKNAVQNSDDILTLINESRYSLIRKKIFDKINTSNFNNNDKNLRLETACFKNISRNLSTKVNRKIEFNKNNNNDLKLERYLNKLKANQPNKYTQLFVMKKKSLYELINLKKQIHLNRKEISPLNNIVNINNSTKLKEGKNTSFTKIKLLSQDKNMIINYYRGDINSLLKILEEKIPLSKIFKNNKNIFNLDDSIYKKEFYLKGAFPKILTLTNEENKINDKNNILGLCSFNYEWKEDPKCLKLKINYIITNDNNNYEKYIEKIINFIKINVRYDRIELKLINDDLSKNLVNYFKKELQFNWSNIQKNQKEKSQYITLYYEKPEIKDLTDIFILKNKSIITLDNKEKENKNENITNKDDIFINKNNIYYLLSENKNIKFECQNESKLQEINNIKNNISKFSKIENNYKINDDKDIKKYFNEDKLKEINDKGILLNMNLKINFENCYSVVINNIYYNKIFSEQMQVYQDENTKTIFYLIPSQDTPFSFNICGINPGLKNLLINSNDKKSIYEKFLDLFSNTSIKLINTTKKSLYIPAFLIENYLTSNNFEEIEGNIKIFDESSSTPLHVSNFDEIINAKFKPDFDIQNNFIDNENNIGDNNYVIKDDFIIGIFKNGTIKDNKLALIQILYVETANFTKKINLVNKQ